MFLLLWFASYFLSIGHIVSWSDFIIVVIGQLVLFVIYLYFSGIRTVDRLERIDYIFQLSLYCMVVLGVIQLALYYVIGSTWGISHISHGVGLPRSAALCLEPDWYGVICMMAMLFMLMNITNKERFFGKKIDHVVLLISGVALILNLTRAAWVGAIGAVLFVLFIGSGKIGSKMRRRIVRVIILAIPLVFVTGLVLSYASPDLFAKLVTRLNVKLWNSNDGGAIGSRTAAINVMLHYFRLHPFTGNGVGGMGEISSNSTLLKMLGYDYQINAGRGSANIIITNLFDVGIFGTLFLIAFFIVVFKKGIATYKKTGEYKLLTYIVVLIGLLVDFQFNNGLRQAYVWIILGIILSYTKLEKVNTVT